jgi:hypothetical protein
VWQSSTHRRSKIAIVKYPQTIFIVLKFSQHTSTRFLLSIGMFTVSPLKIFLWMKCFDQIQRASDPNQSRLNFYSCTKCFFGSLEERTRWGKLWVTLNTKLWKERNKECPEFPFDHKMSLLPLSIMCVSHLGSRRTIQKERNWLLMMQLNQIK